MFSDNEEFAAYVKMVLLKWVNTRDSQLSQFDIDLCFKFQLLFEKMHIWKFGRLSLLFDISHTEAQDD